MALSGIGIPVAAGVRRLLRIRCLDGAGDRPRAV